MTEDINKEIPFEHQFEGRYNFIFKGLHFIHSDSARDQSRCPHCDFQVTDYHMGIQPVMDNEAIDFRFIGFKMLYTWSYAACFECQHCFEKVFYHMSDSYLIILIRKNPELAKFVDKIREIVWETCDDEMKWILWGIEIDQYRLLD